jgi:plastocyanin
MDSRKRRNRGMKRLMAGLALAVVAAIGPAGSQAATPKLTATVGPGFTISLKTPAGKKVTVLKPGAYAITVNDRSASHDFRLKGPGVNKVFSSVAAVGKKTVTVRLRAGSYLFTCQPHAAAMRGAFKVR